MEEARLNEEEEEEEEKEGEDVILGELRELQQTLDKVQINLSAPHLSEQTPKADPSECPASYTENSAEEKMLVSMAKNLHAQYSYLYPDRKPLLLCPVNEFGVQKFVSTTLRRTLISYSKLYDWQGCARFISDFLTLELLDCPTEVPKQLYSPTWVVRTRRGTCFDFSTLLCSLLLGAGYDAYCVSGYAVKEMCLFDLSQQECPLLKPQGTGGRKRREQEDVNKYKVAPPRELKSKFQQDQEQKIQQARQASLVKQQKAKGLNEECHSDPLWGMRVHSWVLVLAEKRDIVENFFIDPLSGQSYPTSSAHFLGIESVWNHENYWINMQDCRFGCTEMTYDLHDVLKWEYMLCGPGNSSLLGEEQEEQDDEETDESKHFEMPRSWVTQIHISEKDMESRYPGGSKVIRYRRAMLEKFSPYLLEDGLVTRLTTYDDPECTHINTVKEWYENRQDKLLKRELNKATNVTTEHFSSGRSFYLKTHTYMTLVHQTEHHMEFYSKTRADNLVSRVDTPTGMTEKFQDRSDFLYYRHVVYGPFEPAQKLGVQRPIQVDPLAKPSPKSHLYQTLMVLMKEEEKVLISIKDSENEVGYILQVREQEESAIMLTISTYDIARNEKARLHVENLKHLARKKQLSKEYKIVDILAPFLAQMGDPAYLTKQQAVQVHAACLGNLKQRLIDKANLIQAQFEKETQELLQKQQWYQKNQFNLTKQDEEAYLAYCSEAMFRIKILKLRLNRHKDKAPQKYLALDKVLRQDHRLMHYLD
ncbi:dynein regulatory complex subunit 7 isoform X2 [Neoarius graeffei]|uniref:dynein regulatory complex subunit 7 isoform X2 n=1 Tax=Neoarius graeffei TaxID=443677 RepID=UPI00298C82CC|nr:dynein regulatory complex subunit 7 isoform X2 [Neoarius graeffei]